jgi:DNA modification methylase
MTIKTLQGDTRQVLKTLPDASVHCCVTSPPYFGLRDYGMPEQIGLEETPAEFIEQLVIVFREVRRVLRDDGTLWLNIGDSYANDTKWGGKHAQGVHGNSGIGRRRTATGYKSKELMGIPWQLAFALSADGWYLRQDIIWHKPNPMPESIKDRCTKAHEYVFLLSKAERYYWDLDAMQEPAAFPAGPGNVEISPAVPGLAEHNNRSGLHKIGAREKRSVWSINTKPFSEAHFATMAPELAETCIKAGCPIGGTVLDPFGGAGTTGLVADQLQRDAVLIELNPEYLEISRKRISDDAPLFAEVDHVPSPA